jgi:hypothetical protein
MPDLLTDHTILVLAGTLVGAIAVGWLSGRAVVVVARWARRPFLRRARDRCHKAWVATLVTVSDLVAVGSAGLSADVERPLRHALVIATIGAVSWLAATVAFPSRTASYTA